MTKLLISAIWDEKKNIPFLKYYDLDREIIQLQRDWHYKNHWLSSNPKDGKRVKLYDSLYDKDIALYRHEGDGHIPKEERDQWVFYEHKLRKHHNYLLTKGLICGAIYDSKGNLVKQELDTEQQKALQTMLANAKDLNNPEYLQYLTEYTSILSQPIPSDIKRLAIDIEVYTERGIFPSLKNAYNVVTCIGFVDNRGWKKTFTLSNEKYHKHNPKDKKDFIIYFDNERTLIEAAFETINTYPCIVTFNGDDFDLAYLYQRAKRIGIEKIPIFFNEKDLYKPASQPKDAVLLENAIHLDLFRIFKNKSLHNYAFNAKYKQFSLDSVSMAMLKEGKVKFSKPLNELTQEELSYYCLNDTELTLKLTTYSNNLLIKLLVLISRITKTSIEDIGRFGISNWLKQMMYHEHRKRNILIPNREDLSMKGGASTESIIKDKKYKGAFVMDPVKGVHFNVKCIDFGCFDTETEILTKRGWQTINTIQEGEECLSVNLKTGDVENDIIQEVFKYDYDGDLVNIKTDRKIDFLFTDTHRMVYNRKKGGNKSGFRKELIVQPFKDITYYHYALPCFGTWKGNEKQDKLQIGEFEFNTNDFFEFLGRFLGNGYLNEKYLTITDNLKYKDRHISIKRIFENMGFKPYQKSDNRGKQGLTTRINNVKFAKVFRELLQNKIHSSDRTIPEQFLDYNIQHLYYLFKGLMESDGCTQNTGEKTFCSTNKELAEQFQLLALKCGYNCHFRKTHLIGFKGVARECYICTLSGFRQKKASFVISKQQSHIHKVKYKGKIWCASTRNTTLIIRRKGRVIVTGNSLYPSIIKSNNISYETINCGHKECIDNKVPETNHYTCTKKLGLIPLLIGVFRDLRIEYFKKLSKNKTLSKEDQEIYDAITQGVKVILNGSYGVLGAEAFQLYCLPVAESVTALGRHIIQKTKEYVESLGLKVVYGDTDSLFVINPTDFQLRKIMDYTQDKFKIDIELDKEYRYIMFSGLKKNYFGIKKDGKLDTKGLVGKKSNIPKFARECFSEICRELAKVIVPEEMEQAKEKVKSIVKTYYSRLNKLDFPLEDFAYNQMINKDVDKYGKVKQRPDYKLVIDRDIFKDSSVGERLTNVPIHAEVAKQMRAAGEQLEEKMFIPYIKTFGNKGKWIKIARKTDIDKERYRETLISVIKPLFQTLDLDVEWIVSGQTNLLLEAFI